MNEDRIIEQFIERQVDVEREVDRLKAMGAVELDSDGQPEKVLTMSDVGIHNRRDARRAGLKNPSRSRTMALPRAAKRKRRRR